MKVSIIVLMLSVVLLMYVTLKTIRSSNKIAKGAIGAYSQLKHAMIHIRMMLQQRYIDNMTIAALANKLTESQITITNVDDILMDYVNTNADCSTRDTIMRYKAELTEYNINEFSLDNIVDQ